MDQHWQQPPDPPPGAEDLPLAGLLAELLATSEAAENAAPEAPPGAAAAPEAVEWPVEAAPPTEAPDLLRALDEAGHCRQEAEGADISGILLARLLEESAAEAVAEEAPGTEAGASAAAPEAQPPAVAGGVDAPAEPPVLKQSPQLPATVTGEIPDEPAIPYGLAPGATPETAGELPDTLSALPEEASGGEDTLHAAAALESGSTLEPLAEPADELPACLAAPAPAESESAEPVGAIAGLLPESGPHAPDFPAEQSLEEPLSPAGAAWTQPDAPAAEGLGRVLPEEAGGEAAQHQENAAASLLDMEAAGLVPPSAEPAEEPLLLADAALAQHMRQPAEPPLAPPPAEGAAPAPEFSPGEAALPAAPLCSNWRAPAAEPPHEEDDFELVDADQAERMVDRLLDAARSIMRSSIPAAMPASQEGKPAEASAAPAAASAAPPPSPAAEGPVRRLTDEPQSDASPVPPAAALMALGLPERLRTRLESIGDLDRILKSRSTLTAAPEQGPRLLVFRVGGQSCGLHMEHVREVERVGRVTAVPGAPAFVKGLINLRGEILPLVDLAALLGEGRHAGTQGRLVVAQAGPEEPPVALLVEELNGLAPLRPDNVAPAPRPEVSRGVIEHRGRQVLWLDPAAIFSAEALERAAQSAGRP
jgi:purine-binding chemotaxis protein CheW